MIPFTKLLQGSFGHLGFTALDSFKTLPLYRASLYYYSTSGDKKGGNDDDKEPCDPAPCPVCQCPSDYNPSTPTMYDSRKYGHCLPSNSVMPCFEPLPHLPSGIFRCTAGEVLGGAAAKCSYYQNPEYFSYQHMSFYDLHLLLRSYRNPCPMTGRKP